MSTTAVTTRPQAEDAVVATRHRHLVIRASAGSGKTYQLVVRYLKTLLDGVPAERILASTFTRKAAGEILGRVLGRLAKASHDPADLKQLAAHLGEPTFDRTACLKLLKSLTHELHRMRIGTLDSFFARLAKSYTLELGLPPGWEIANELDDAALRSQAIAAVLYDEKPDDVRRLTNLLSKGDSARSVTAKIRETVDDFYEIYLQTDAAAWRRFPELHRLPKETLAATLDALREVELPPKPPSYAKTRNADCERASAEDWDAFLTTGFPPKVLQGRRTFGNSKAEISQEAFDLYSRLINHARAIVIGELAGRTAATYELLTRFDTAYQHLKHQSRLLRFEDVTRRLAGEFSQEQLGQLAYRLDSDVAHLLLDEFQDTSRFQWGVLRPFAEQISRADEGTGFFCVGDVKQAIYGWRGGVAEIFDAVDQQLPGIDVAPLAKSRRSSQVVIDAVNRLFARLPLHENLKDDEETVRQWCEAFDHHETARDIPGYVTLETPLDTDEPDAEKPLEKVLPAAARRVFEIATAAPQTTIGVLVRRNQSIAPLIHLLQGHGIDASEEGGNPLVDSAGVQLLLSLTTLADHPGDEIARFHVAASPLGPKFEFVDHEDDAAAEQLAAEVRRNLIDDGYGRTFEQWVRLLSPECRRRDRGRLAQLVELAYQYDEQATLRPVRFVEFVETEKVDAPSPARVRVMSIHQAKGLEFDVVVLPMVESNLIARTPTFVAAAESPIDDPDCVSLYAKAELQSLLPEDIQRTFVVARAAQVREELCSLYVAVTRAVHALHIIVPQSDKTGDKLPKNTAGFVRAALIDKPVAESASLLYEHGDRDWVAHTEWKETNEPPESATPSSAPAPLRVELASMVDGRRRGLKPVAPSQADVEQRVRLVQLVRGAKASSLDRGTLIHAWFEQIEWLDDAPPTEDELRRIAEESGFEAALAGKYLASFRAMLRRPAIADVLTKRSYESRTQPPFPQPIRDELASGTLTFEVARERPVAVRLEGDLLRGYIDRLVLLRHNGRVVAADIIDYKTDAVGDRDAADLDRTAHYRRQLAAYSAAIGLIYRLPAERIVARLAFVEKGQVVLV